MNCRQANEYFDEYVMKEMDEGIKNEFEGHLKECTICREELEKSSRLIRSMRKFPSEVRLKEGVLEMKLGEILRHTGNHQRRRLKNWMGIAAGFFLVVSLLSASVVAFPAFASKWVPELPVVKEWSEAKSEAQEAKQQMEVIKQEFEKLKIELKEIKGTKIKEIKTSEGISEEENMKIQEIVLDFIKAQYAGDVERIKGMCTEDLKKKIVERKSDYLFDQNGQVVFSTITNVALEKDRYLVFVRLSDPTLDQSEYQLDFELLKARDGFLVSFVGKDA